MGPLTSPSFLLIASLGKMPSVACSRSRRGRLHRQPRHRVKLTYLVRLPNKKPHKRGASRRGNIYCDASQGPGNPFELCTDPRATRRSARVVALRVRMLSPVPPSCHSPSGPSAWGSPGCWRRPPAFPPPGCALRSAPPASGETIELSAEMTGEPIKTEGARVPRKALAPPRASPAA